MNALMLTLAVRWSGRRIQPLRVLLGALAGAAIAQATQGLSRAQSAFVWLPAALVMMRIAQGRAARRHAMANALLLMCAAGLAGGMVLALWGATGSLALAYALCAVAAVGVAFAHAKRQGKRGWARMICRYGGKSAVFDALIDSGNTLRDYLTHLPVIVLPERTGREALGLHDMPLRPIFAQTAGGRQRMHLLAPQTITLEMDGTSQELRAMLALSPGMSDAMPALVPAQLLDGL